MSSGQQANKTGDILESTIENLLLRQQYLKFPYHKNQIFTNRAVIGGQQYAPQVVIGSTIYGTSRKCDFIIFNKSKFKNDLVIECKWQQAPGSVDEKYPFLLHNIIKTGIPTIIILDGSGYKPQAKQWLASYVDSHNVLLGVYSLEEFMKAVNNGLLI